MNDMQSSAGDPVPDPLGRIAQSQQLATGDHSVLPFDQTPRSRTQIGT
jgi:hypothetical protein